MLHAVTEYQNVERYGDTLLSGDNLLGTQQLVLQINLEMTFLECVTSWGFNMMSKCVIADEKFYQAFHASHLLHVPRAHKNRRLE